VACFLHKKKANKEQIKGILNKYMVVDDLDLQEDNIEFGFNKFVEPENKVIIDL
jgi:hypothetical protein